MAEPIAIACPKCDKSMKVPAQLAGKKIKCKGCEHVFLVPAGKSDEEEVVPIMEEDAPKPAKAKKPAPKPVKAAVKPEPKPAKKDEDDDDSDGKPYGYVETDLGHRCPECANEMEDEDAIICLNCGYNTVTRTRPTVKKLIAHTPLDWILWLAPPILCLLSVFVLLAFDIWYCINIDDLVKDQWYEIVAHHGIKLWIVIMSLGAMFYAGRFGLMRLIFHPKPPEKIKRR